MLNWFKHKMPLLIVASIFHATTFAHAYSIAILPVADLSKGRNGVDLQITSQLAQQLHSKNFSIVDHEKVMEFMVEHSIRRCGELDTLTCRTMANNLKCDTVLVTTILTNQKDTSELSFISTLYDGKTGQGIWSTVLCRHLNDYQPILGIGKKLNNTDIKQGLCLELAQYLEDKPIELPHSSSEDLHNYRVADIKITPELAQADSELHCQLKMYFVDKDPEYIQLNTGSNTVILQKNSTQHYYEGTVKALGVDGIHPINLVINWDSSHQETVTAISNYEVATQPSQLNIRTLAGIDLGDFYAFSRSVKLIPKMHPVRPIDYWQLTIDDEDGKCVVSETHNPPLPKQLQWSGIDNNRRQLDMGRYNMTLKVCDLAGNISEAASTLYLQPKETELVSISQQFNLEKHQIELLPAQNIMIPIEHWAMTLETDDGKIVYTTQGVNLPALVDLPPQLNYDELNCNVRVLDQLGNRSLISGTRFQIDQSKEMFAQQSSLNWSADF